MVDEPRNGNVMAYRVTNVETAVKDHGERIDSLERRWDRLAGAFAVPAAALIITNLVLSVAAVAVLVRG